MSVNGIRDKDRLRFVAAVEPLTLITSKSDDSRRDNFGLVDTASALVKFNLTADTTRGDKMFAATPAIVTLKVTICGKPVAEE